MRPRAAELFRADPAAESIFTRIACCERFLNIPGPIGPEEQLADLIVEHSAGKRTAAEVQSGLASLLTSQLHYPLDRLLESEAPATMQVPSGNRLTIRYAAGQPPTISVRLQEIFGWKETPRMAKSSAGCASGIPRPELSTRAVNRRPDKLLGDHLLSGPQGSAARYPKHACRKTR